MTRIGKFPHRAPPSRPSARVLLQQSARVVPGLRAYQHDGEVFFAQTVHCSRRLPPSAGTPESTA